MSASKQHAPLSSLSRYLITGSMGQLGRALTAAFDEEVAVGRAHEALDITVQKDVDWIPNVNPDLVINCAAYTNVAMADKDPEEGKLCWRTNAVGPYMLARMCAKNGIPLIHISTDFVFGQDRLRTTPYAERDPVGPLGKYAHSKLAGEHAILQVSAEFSKFRYLIIRTAGLFEPPWRETRNFPMTIRNLMSNKRMPELPVVDDVFTNITYAPHLAQAIRSMIEAMGMYRMEKGSDKNSSPRLAVPNGIYHITNSGCVSWHSVAEKVLSGMLATQRTTRLVRTKRLDYCARSGRDPLLAPNYTCLSGKRYSSLMFSDPMPTWQQAMTEWNDLADEYFKGQQVEYPQV